VTGAVFLPLSVTSSLPLFEEKHPVFALPSSSPFQTAGPPLSSDAQIFPLLEHSSFTSPGSFVPLFLFCLFLPGLMESLRSHQSFCYSTSTGL
jgi:hypothetical protein